MVGRLLRRRRRGFLVRAAHRKAELHEAQNLSLPLVVRASCNSALRVFGAKIEGGHFGCESLILTLVMVTRYRRIILLSSLTAALVANILPAAGAASFYIAPRGHDNSPGSKAQPFATFEQARSAVRALRQSTKARGSITIYLRGGIYHMDRTFELTSQDSGDEQTPITWRAYPGEEVRLMGGTRLRSFKPVTDPAILARLGEAARSHVRQTDLKAEGVKDWGHVTADEGPRADLICDQHYLTLARYPNAGEWLRVAGIPTGGNKYEFEGVVHYGRFSYDGDRPAHWQDTNDLWVHGYWVYDWSDQYQRVAKLDLAQHEISPQPPYHHYGYKKGQRFYFVNVLEELDQPGEWYLDRKTGMLYFWPPGDLAKSEIGFPELQQPMMSLNQVHDVCLRGITFECSRAGAITIQGGTRCEVVGCVVRNVGDPAIDVRGGTHHSVRSCDVYEVAGTGIGIDGGDRKALARGEHLVENCEIHHYARLLKTYKPAVQLHGVGNRIAHCAVHDAPHMGIGYAGNDHVIEYCDFYRIAQETGDVGVTYTMGDWTYMGHEFRYNYFHNVHGPGNLGCFTIYPDLPCGGIHLHGNVFFDLDQVFHSNSGRGMVVENNLFLRCGKGFSFLPWDDHSMFQEGGAWKMVEHLKDVHYDQPPYSERYPVLQRLAEDFAKGPSQLRERELPKENVIRRNVSDTAIFLVVFPPGNLDHVRVETNVLADAVLFEGSFDGRGKSKTYHNGDAEIAAEFGKRGNVIVRGDPGFDQLRTQNFALGKHSPAARLGLERIPFERIGLYRDGDRRLLPATIFPPVVRPRSCTYSNAMPIEILPTPAPHGRPVEIHYTLDGSEPILSSPTYLQPLALRHPATLKVASFQRRSGSSIKSETVSCVYRAGDTKPAK